MAESFKLKREIDIVSIATFLVGLVIALIQMGAHFRGPDIRLYPPEVIVLAIEEYPNEKFYLRIAARMAYVNHGSPGYSATISGEEVEFSFATGETYSQRWHSERTIYSEGEVLVNNFVKEAGPFAIDGGSSVSREMYFAPFPTQCPDGTSDCDEYYRNYIPGSQVLLLLQQAQSIDMTFKAGLIGQNPTIASTSCRLDISRQVIESLANRKWASVGCLH